MLPFGYFMMRSLDLKTHVFEHKADIAARVFAFVYRGEVEITALVVCYCRRLAFRVRGGEPFVAVASEADGLVEARVDGRRRAGRLPTVSVLTGFDYARPNPRIFPRADEWNSSWDAGVTVRWNAWDAGRTSADVAEAASLAGATRERLAAELSDANRKLREYALQAEELAATRERNRMAREIHDSVGHCLTVVHAQLVAARPHALRRHRIGDQRNALRALRAQRELQAGPVAVDPVGDEPHRHAFVAQSGPNRPRGAVIEGRHGVEEVRGLRRPGVDATNEALVARIGVPEADDDAALTEATDALERAVALGGERHDLDEAGEQQQVVEQVIPG
jgi:hypothetical protein